MRRDRRQSDLSPLRALLVKDCFCAQLPSLRHARDIPRLWVQNLARQESQDQAMRPRPFPTETRKDVSKDITHLVSGHSKKERAWGRLPRLGRNVGRGTAKSGAGLSLNICIGHQDMERNART